MNRSMNSMIMIAAATLTMGVSAAYGQTTLKADIPFSFRASGKTLPAGTYTVRETNTHVGAKALIISNSEDSVLVMSTNRIYQNDRNHTPVKMTFACSETGCALSQVWDGIEGLQFSLPRHNRTEGERMATVRLSSPANGQ